MGGCKKCLASGTCDKAEDFPKCPLDGTAFAKLQRLWAKLHAEYSGTGKKDKCKVVLLDSGLWLARPDRKLGNPEAVVDLQAFPGRSLGIRRLRTGGTHQIRLRFESGKELAFPISTADEHHAAGMRWRVPSG